LVVGEEKCRSFEAGVDLSGKIENLEVSQPKMASRQALNTALHADHRQMPRYFRVVSFLSTHNKLEVYSIAFRTMTEYSDAFGESHREQRNQPPDSPWMLSAGAPFSFTGVPKYHFLY